MDVFIINNDDEDKSLQTESMMVEGNAPPSISSVQNENAILFAEFEKLEMSSSEESGDGRYSLIP